MRTLHQGVTLTFHSHLIGQSRAGNVSSQEGRESGKFSEQNQCLLQIINSQSESICTLIEDIWPK